MYEKKNIAFTGGGTGGHVFPGLAIIEELQANKKNVNIDCIWIGSFGSEKEYVTKAGIPFYGVSSGKLRRYVSFKNCSDFFKVLFGIMQAKKLLKDLKPSVVVSIGGFVSVPTVLAARMLKIPVVSVVCDLSLGLATKINSYVSDCMLFVYKDTLQHFTQLQKLKKRKAIPKVFAFGMPIRKACFQGSASALNKTYGIKNSQKVLVVLGGSLGSIQINNIVCKLLPTLKKDVTVLHQTGIQENIAANINSKDIVAQYIEVPFFSDDYGSVLQRADVALARAGAGTLWELTSTKIPSVIVPLSKNISRGDQIENAQYFAKAGAIENVGSDPDIEHVNKLIHSLLYKEDAASRLKTGCLQFFAQHSVVEYSKIIETYVYEV